MRLFLSILLILFCVNIFSQGHKYTLNIPDYYGVGQICSIDIWMPNDSATGLHPAIICANGSGEQGSSNNASGGLGNLVATSNATLRTNNAAKGGTSTFIVATIHVLSGNMDMRYYKNAYRYLTTVKGAMIDVTQINIQGLSLSGGVVNDLIDQNNSDSSALWASRIASFSTGSAVSGLVNTNPRVLANINTNNVHLRIYYCDDDGNTFSQSQNLNIASLSRGFSPGNTYAHKPDLMFIMTGGHFGGYNAMIDTLHRTWLADSSVEHGGNSAWLNKTYIHNPNDFEWMLQFQTSAIVPNQPPVSNAGSNQSINLPTSSVTLNGSASYDPDGRPLDPTGYLWTRVSGPNTPTITSSTSVSTTVTGLILGTYVFNLRVRDDSAATANSTVTITVNPVADIKAKIYEDYDFYYSGSDLHKAKWFYDGDITTEGSPRKYQDWYGWKHKVGTVQAYHQWTKYGECRGWFDLVGDTAVRDTTHKFKITKIRVYSTGVSGFKMIFYNGDKFMRPTYHSRPQGVHDPIGSGFVPLDSMTTITTPGWVTVTLAVPDSMRYVYVQMTGDTSSFNLFKASEVEFLGQYLYDTSTITKRGKLYTGAMPTQYTDSTKWSDKNGINLFNMIGPNGISWWDRYRIFWNNYSDTAVAAGIPALYQDPLTKFSVLNLSKLKTEFKDKGKEIYFTNQGPDAHVQSLNPGQTMTPDTVGGNLSNPANYRRVVDNVDQMVKVTGRNTSGTNKYSDHPANGQDLFMYITIGNELNGHDGINNTDLWALLTTAYDGYESTITVDGAPIGVKNMDPTMQFVLPAGVDWDAQQLKTLWFYSKLFRADGKVPFDVVDQHKYLSTTDSLGGIVFDIENKVGAMSQTPEKALLAGLQKETDTLHRLIYNFLGVGFPTWWSETGRSKNGSVAKTPTQAGAWDESSTPGFGPYDSLRAPAVLNIREALLTMATQFRRRYYYVMENSSGATQSAGRFASHGVAYAHNPSTQEMDGKYPDWFVNAATKPFANYSFQTFVLPETYSGRNQMQFRKYGTDSVCQVVWFGTRDGTNASQVIFLYNNYRVTRTVTELPVFYYYKESNPTNVLEVIPSFTSETPTNSNLTATDGSDPASGQIIRFKRRLIKL